ncbi:MAG: hypothetical protein QOD67_226 [Caballeronia sp.]|nr:hypothetical protein [Caballeronia sp.]
MPPGSDGWNMNKLKWPVIGGVGGKGQALSKARNLGHASLAGRPNHGRTALKR